MFNCFGANIMFVFRNATQGHLNVPLFFYKLKLSLQKHLSNNVMLCFYINKCYIEIFGYNFQQNGTEIGSTYLDLGRLSLFIVNIYSVLF